MATAGVQDHRQIILLCQLQLCLEQRLLAFKLRLGHIQIQPNLPHRHQLLRLACQATCQLFKLLIMVLGDIQRV
ncbi:hypothetical protein D3C75_1137580 [compost metagenome]